jgi:hypothetical protein
MNWMLSGSSLGAQWELSGSSSQLQVSQYNNTTTWQYNMRCHINMSQYLRTFICNKVFMIRHENIHKLVRIDNIRPTSDYGMNHICKLVIESKMLVLFAWQTQKEFRQMNTTCNYLEDRIWIADDVRVEECSRATVVFSVTFGNMSLSFSNSISIIATCTTNLAVP